ncbi:MAG: ATP-binding protein [Deltaproteobacteria bacterium]|nr:ATP-binding protein [Deltaproteobacteria bacterium]
MEFLPFVTDLQRRLEERAPLIQVVLGPRQVGKTTGIKHCQKKLKAGAVYVSADDLPVHGRAWLIEQWQKARVNGRGTVLIIDEIQKIGNWSETIKLLWDETRRGDVKVVLLGSSSLELQKGLTESLAGRYEAIQVHHWNFHESRAIRKLTLEQYLEFGGYPGSYSLLKDEERLRNYVLQSIIDRVIDKDILSLARVKSPALFRQSFEILCSYPAQEISLTKLLGQLQEGGNVELVKYYITLFEGAFLVKALRKYSTKPIKTRVSSPKILPMCPALTLISAKPPEIGRQLELAVGALLARNFRNLYYWRDGAHEVDFIVDDRSGLYAIEVKSGRRKSTRGLDEFLKRCPNGRPVFIDLENFELFDKDPKAFLSRLAR